MVPYLRAANVKDGILDLGDVKEMNFTPAEQDIFSLLPGDVLVSEGSGSLRTVGANAVWNGELPGPICFQNTLLRLRPRPGTSPRFLSWWCRFAFADGLFASIASGANIYHVSAERVRSLPMLQMTPSEQTAIADYLDAETARIDALIQRRRRQSEAVDERWQSVLSNAFSHQNPLRLKRLLRSPLAYGVLVPEHDLDGVPMLRIMDLRETRVDLATVVRIPPALSAQYRRTVLAPGDLVVSVVGTLGRSVVVEDDLAGCNLNRALARVQLQPDVPRSLVRLWFGSGRFQRLAQLATSSDSAQATLGLEDLGNFPLGLPEDRALWSGLTNALEEQESRVRRTLAALDRQVALLLEHRQALITAAVTGEVAIPGVAA